PAHGRGAVALPENLEREHVQPLELERLLAPLAQILVDAPRELVRAHRPDTDRDERPRHQPFRVRLIGAAERERIGVAGVAHARTPAGTSPASRCAGPGARTS